MVLTIVELLLFILALLLLTNYYAIPLSFLPFESMMTTKNTKPHYLRNSLLYLSFWVQHILMATLFYKNAWFKRFKYFALYDRYLYNVVSGLTILLIFYYVKPATSEPFFTLPTYICMPLDIIGLLIYIETMRLFGSNLFMPYSIS